MLVVLLQLIEKNSPAKAPSPKTMLRMRAAETSPPSIPVSVSSLHHGRRLHAGHLDLPARQRSLSLLEVSLRPALGASCAEARTPEVDVWDATERGPLPPSPENLDKRARRARRGRGGEAAAAERGRGGRPGPSQDQPPLALAAATRTRILWAVLRKQRGRRSLLCGYKVQEPQQRLEPGSQTQTAGREAAGLHFSPPASGGVNPAREEAAGHWAARVSRPDHSNKLEKS